MHAILHIPHSSLHLPEEYLEQFLLSGDELHRQALLVADLFTEELFQDSLRSRAAVVYPVSRLLVDPERFLDDALESGANHGLGAIYTHTPWGVPLRRTLLESERNLLLAAFYHPHHLALTCAVDEALINGGAALIIDGHSFPVAPYPFQDASGHDRPEICVGTDPFRTPAWLRDAVTEEFLARGYTVSWNHPFSGSLVPAVHFRNSPKVLSLMIEVRRDLILDQSMEQKSGRFEEVRRDVLAAISAAETALDSHREMANS